MMRACQRDTGTTLLGLLQDKLGTMWAPKHTIITKGYSPLKNTRIHTGRKRKEERREGGREGKRGKFAFPGESQQANINVKRMMEFQKITNWHPP